MSNKIAVFLNITFLLIYLVYPHSKAMAELSSADWKSDIQYLEENVSEYHIDFFKKHSQEEFYAGTKELKNNLEKLSDQQIRIKIAQIIALAKDGHSFVEGLHPLVSSEFKKPFLLKRIPIRFYAFSDGIYVYSADQNHKHILGAKLIKVAGTPAKAALKKVATVFPAENEMAVAAWGVYGLESPEILFSHALSDSPDAASFTLEINGSLQNLRLSTTDITPVEHRGWAFHPEWHSSWNNKPTYLQSIKQPAFFKQIPHEKIAYLKINSFQKGALDIVQKEIEKATLFIQKNSEYKFILDIRHHTGGETHMANHLVRSIAATEANINNNLYVIIGRRTFSAGQLLATGLEQYTNATFVGEPTGINIHFFANTRPNLILPKSGLKIFLSTSWWQLTNQQDKRLTQEPDIYTPLSYQQFSEGIDPAFNAISHLP